MKTYGAEREAFACKLVATTGRLFQIMTDPGLPGIFARKVLMPFIMSLLLRPCVIIAGKQKMPPPVFPYSEGARGVALSENAVYLIRPDDCIGFAGKSGDAGLLARYRAKYR